MKVSKMHGIYEINCNDYQENYYGESCKAIETHYSEHLALIIYGGSEKSKVIMF